MKVTVDIPDNVIASILRGVIDDKLSSLNTENTIDARINHYVDKVLKRKLSEQKVENFVRDRISRIITTDSIKDYALGINGDDVLSNLESKILLMIGKSAEFKKLVKTVLKDSL